LFGRRPIAPVFTRIQGTDRFAEIVELISDHLRLQVIDADLVTVCNPAKISGSQYAMSISAQDLDLFWVLDAPRTSIPASRPVVPLYRVGEPLQRGRRHWPTGTQYTHGYNGHELTLFLPEIDDRHVQDVKSGEGEFAVIARLPLIVLAYRFGQSVRVAHRPQSPGRFALPSDQSARPEQP